MRPTKASCVFEQKQYVLEKDYGFYLSVAGAEFSCGENENEVIPIKVTRR